MKAGLQGITIAPKKKPKRKAFNSGLFEVGTFILGKNLLKSILKINNNPMMASIKNAIGDITPITLVNETCKMVVNIKPNKNINKITPEKISKPNPNICFLVAFTDILLDK